MNVWDLISLAMFHAGTTRSFLFFSGSRDAFKPHFGEFESSSIQFNSSKVRPRPRVLKAEYILACGTCLGNPDVDTQVHSFSSELLTGR